MHSFEFPPFFLDKKFNGYFTESLPGNTQFVQLELSSQCCPCCISSFKAVSLNSVSGNNNLGISIRRGVRNRAAVSKGIEYYDDEELDRFKGWPSDVYQEAEIEEFREVLYTLQEIEVAGWLRSLQLREINLPDDLKDEAFLIVGERRIH